MKYRLPAAAAAIIAAASLGLTAVPAPVFAAPKISAAASADFQAYPLVISDIDLSPAAPVSGALTITPTISSYGTVKSVGVSIKPPSGQIVKIAALTAPWTMRWNTAGQTGTAMITMTATDSLGNTTVATTSVLVDNALPSAAITLAGLVGGVTPVALTTPSDDTAKMDVYVQNSLVGSATSAPWSVDWDTTAFTGTVTVKVVVTDTAGNMSTTTKVVGVDNTGPKLTWSGPINSAKTALRGTIGVKAGAIDPAGTTLVEVLGPDGSVLGTSTVSPYVIPVDTTGFDGSTTLTLRATDKLGNVSTLDQPLVFDNTAPEITDLVVSPASPARGTVTLTPQITENTGLKGVGVTLTLPNGKKIALSAGLAPYTMSWVSNGTTGTVTAVVTAIDLAGNTGTSTTTFTVDNTMPSATWTMANYVTGIVPVALNNPSDDTASMQLLIRGKVVDEITSAPWSIDWDTTGMSGPTQVMIKTTDTAGNAASVVKTIYVDYAGPVAAVTSNIKISGKAQIRLSVTDGAGIASVELLDASGQSLATSTTGPYTLNVDTTGMAKGSVTWTLKATDKLGNVRSVPKTFVIA
ncbi:Ig-like domain-containing protein [Actinoplanes sp. NPDC026619]|uniref:Ig-like domain-containing protein n=1 Tax=Actinoplanes sp. NPDC026619 TaxID=3155798 RepID=UPI0033C91F96